MAATLSTETVAYGDGATTFEGYFVTPDADAPRPCVLLAHDWSGLHAGIRAIADKLAGLGHACLALDLYGRGVRGDPVGDNSHLMAPLMADRARLRRRLLAGLDAAARHPAVDRNRLAAVGYCFGGLCALDLARAAPTGLRAAVSVHGVLQPPGLGAQSPISASVLVLHGWEDPMAPPEAVLGIAREFTDAGADWHLVAFGHALHAFTFEGLDAPARGLAYDERAARRSWALMTDFLAEALGRRRGPP